MSGTVSPDGDAWLTDRGTFILPPPLFRAITPPSFPASWAVHIPSGPVYCCDIHAEGVIKFSNAMGFKPGLQRIAAHTLHNCRGCVAYDKAQYQARFKEGRAYEG